MSVDLIFDKSSIQTKGGLKWSYTRVSEDGTNDGSTGWVTGVYREKTKTAFDQPDEVVKLEDGSQVIAGLGDFTGKVEITSAQDDVATENFIIDESKLHYFAIIMDCGISSGTKHKIRYIPLASIEAKYDTDSPARRPVISIIPLVISNTSCIPRTLPSWVTGATTAYTVNQGNYRIAVEQ